MKTGADFIFVGSGAVELATRKAGGIVRVWKGWCGARVGVAIPPVVARIFSGDSTSPLTRGGKNVVRSEGEASNPSGSRPNFFGRQHLTFDKGGKCDGDF